MKPVTRPQVGAFSSLRARLAPAVSILCTPALLILGVAGSFAQMYSITDLAGPYGYAVDINAGGQVAGYFDFNGNYTHAFLYSGGPLQPLATLGGTESYAAGINDSGQIVGEAYTTNNTAYHAFLYSGGFMTDLGTLGGTYSSALAINNNGEITGQADTPTNTHAFLYSGGQMHDLGTLGGTYSYGRAINTKDEVVGDAHTGSADHAFLYSGGHMSDLGTLGGSYSVGLGINDSGQVVGHSFNSNGVERAFLYSAGAMTELGTLTGSPYGMSEAYGINNKGQVVGADRTIYHAYLYSAGVMTDLNDLIPANSGWTLKSAVAINDNGLIVGQGNNPAGAYDAFLLTPLPAGYNRIALQVLSDGDVRLSCLGTGGTNYALERSFSLKPAVWVAKQTNVAGLDGTLVFTNSPNPTTNNFWRIRAVQ